MAMGADTAAVRSGEYVLGTDEQEAVRLGLQHRLWAATAHEAWERAGIAPGMTVLDVGCGPGHASLDLAEIVGPRGRVLAVDESAAFLKQLQDQVVARRLGTVERILADAQHLETLEIAPGSVDLAYARWVLCFVADPEGVVRGAARAIRPGGRFVVQDYFNYESMTVAPKSAAFSRVIAAIGRSWRERGGDPDVVGRVPGMMLRNGFEIVDVRVHSRVARPGSTMWHWPDTFWASYLPRLESMGLISAAERREFEEEWARASRDPGAFIFLPPVWDVIGVRLDR